MTLSPRGTEFQIQNSLDLIASTNTPKLLLCAGLCNMNRTCHTSDYDSTSGRCRLFEGDRDHEFHRSIDIVGIHRRQCSPIARILPSGAQSTVPNMSTESLRIVPIEHHRHLPVSITHVLGWIDVLSAID